MLGFATALPSGLEINFLSLKDTLLTFIFHSLTSMSTTIKTEISDQLWHQAQTLVEKGWVHNMDELISESIRRYLESHQELMSERFIREDIEWGLHGEE